MHGAKPHRLPAAAPHNPARLLAWAAALACACAGAGPADGPGQLHLDSLRLPPGFVVETFARDLLTPRMMAWSPGGMLHVSQPLDGSIVALPDGNGDGMADEVRIWARGLDRVHGLAFHDGHLYVAETGRVLRYPFVEGRAAEGEPETLIADVPPGGQHWTRTIAFGPEGALYVSVGSSCNVCEEEDPRRAAVTRYDRLGGEETLFAAGLRNSVGLAFHPISGQLWATDNGRDWLGDDLPPEEINVLREGGFYGWPYAYGERVPDPEFGSRAPDRVADSIPPLVSLQAHTAPLGLAFYTGGQFPEEYRGDLFVAQHGSWNRSSPVGYQVVRVELGGPEGSTPGAVRTFLTGFLQPRGAWGRPVDVSVGPTDGALYVTDDRAGAVYRIFHTGEKP